MNLIKDCESRDLEIGALYVCGLNDGPDATYGELVRYVGIVEGRQTFADADTWEEFRPDFDFLLRQNAQVIDPRTQGW